MTDQKRIIKSKSSGKKEQKTVHHAVLPVDRRYEEQAEKLKQMDQAVDDILNTLGNQESREPGIQVRHDVRLLSDEELWIKFRQRSGE